MSLTLTLTANSAAELREQILELAAQYAPPPAIAKPAETKSTKRTTTAAIAPAPVSEPEAVDEPEPQTVPEPVREVPRELVLGDDARPAANPVAEPASELTFESDITPAVLTLVNAKGRDAIIGVLAAFGVTRASQCNISQYPALLAALQDAAK